MATPRRARKDFDLTQSDLIQHKLTPTQRKQRKENADRYTAAHRRSESSDLPKSARRTSLHTPRDSDDEEAALEVLRADVPGSSIPKWGLYSEIDFDKEVANWERLRRRSHPRSVSGPVRTTDETSPPSRHTRMSSSSGPASPSYNPEPRVQQPWQKLKTAAAHQTCLDPELASEVGTGLQFMNSTMENYIYGFNTQNGDGADTRGIEALVHQSKRAIGLLTKFVDKAAQDHAAQQQRIQELEEKLEHSDRHARGMEKRLHLALDEIASMNVQLMELKLICKFNAKYSN
ncbi:uncharacterized protein BJ171DRAFT_61720 [Polychytrium aggregatum]|uniref:uncharacterized protein n=1 Tax=Polychytrium aggregatum TaxID=110093 RepID=UPI0022FDD34C|nr:uncharacterized protein BJ171DRAFT_61720 [Polychytrium aggregatum]KAI9205481.1 hypothetical protein BJ171DRAFT_61720 [Polychytrium aggregatum]